MAAPSTAAPATADAPKPAGSGASTASTTTQTADPSPVSFDPTAAIDVEDLLTGAETAPEAESNQDDQNRDDDANPNADKPTGEQDKPKPEEKDDSEEREDEEPEVVEDQDGKRLVSAKHLERALKQRATAKQEAREALARVEAAEKEAADLKAQLTTLTEKPAVTGTALTGLVPKLDPNNAEQVTQLEEHAQAWLDWCEENPTGGAPNQGGEEWTQKEVLTQKRWAQSVLKAIPEHRQFQAQFAEERSKVKAELPKLFQVGTDEQKAFAAEQRKLLSVASAKDQDQIIARQVLTKDIPLKDLAELVERHKEVKAGIADYPRVPKKTSTKPAGETADKPKPKAVVVTTRPVGSLKPGSADGSRKPLAERLAAGPVDVEDVLDD